MLSNWQKAYTELTEFIDEYPEVEFKVSVVSIQEDIRHEFYRIFNVIRTAFIEEKFPFLLNEARTLSGSYTKVEEEVSKILGLENVSVTDDLRRFLHNPIDELIRVLFDPLFDLLKERIDIETFEERASRNIEASFGPLYRTGYEKWVALSLVKLLEADKLFQVIPHMICVRGRQSGSFEEKAPAPEEAMRLLFKQEPVAAFTVPDFIVHSAKVNQYIALRSEIGRALSIASNASEEREWYHIDLKVALGLGLSVIYLADEPKEIALVADRNKVCRPDLIIECREQKEWYEKEGLEKVNLHHDILKPRLGTYIVSKEHVPEQAYQELMLEQASGETVPEKEHEPVSGQDHEKQGVNIHILSVGFDQSKLEPIISILMKPENKD